MYTEIDLRRLQHLLLLAEELNFTRAAERAHLSQTAFSRSIQALEAGFGIRAFDRDTRSVRLTAAGLHLVQRAQGLLAHARDVARDVDGMANADGGTLAFGASLMAVDGIFKGVLPLLQRQSPRLRIRVEVSQWQLLRQHLEQERIEFFVAYPGPLAADPTFKVTPLAGQVASVFCRAGHPLAGQGQLIPWPQLRDYPWGSVQMTDEHGERLRALTGTAAGEELPVTMSCDNKALLRESMLASDMLLLTWQSWLADDLASGAVVDLASRLTPRPTADLHIECAIVQLAGRTALPAARRLIGLIKSE